MDVPPNRDESLEVLISFTGTCPWTKPFKLGLTQRVFPGTNSLKCLHEETCARYESLELFIPRFNIQAATVHIHKRDSIVFVPITPEIAISKKKNPRRRKNSQSTLFSG